MKNITKRCAVILSTLAAAVGLFAGTALAQTPAEGGPDIGAFEYGYDSHAVRTFTTPDDTFDPAVYGEGNTSFIYVAADGSDTTGSGTEDAPFATVHKAASVAQPGQTIKVGAGTFVFTESADIPVGVSLEGMGAQTVFTSTTLTATTMGGAIALVRLHSEGDAKEDGNQHVSFITFDGQQTAAWAIDVANRHNVSVHDCTITDFCEAGVGWHATDLSAQSIEDTNPDVTTINGTFVTGGRFYNNYLKDNTYFDGWGRGSLFMCGLEDFRVYGNTIIEDVRTSPVGSRGVPVKAWYYAGWMRGLKIYDNDIQRLGSALQSSDGSGWDFAIEMAAPYAGVEIFNNHFVGSVDLNSGYVSMGDKTYDYSAWIHDNTWTADPDPKYDGTTAFYNEEYAITLERLTQKTLIEYNTVTGYDTVVYFNGRQEISDVTFRYNLCTELGGRGGTMFRMDGRTSNGFADTITVTNLAIYNNVFSATDGNGNDGAGGSSGFGIVLGQNMDCPWSLKNVSVVNNVVNGCVYPYWFAVMSSPTAIDGLNVENNIIHGESGISVPTAGVAGYVNADNTVLDDTAWAAAFGSDWYLAADSPAVDGGTLVAADLVDLAGNPVPYTAPAATYTVSYAYEANAPETAPALPVGGNYAAGATVTVAADAVLEGYTFNGWHTAPGCAVTVGDAAATFTMPAADVVLYGAWTQVPPAPTSYAYTVEYYYESQGAYPAAASSSDSRSGDPGAAVAVTDDDKTPGQDGYVFDEGAANVLSGTLDADGTLVLKVYFKQQFVISFGLDGGTLGDYTGTYVRTCGYGETIIIPAAPVKEGYTFLYWEGSQYYPGDTYEVTGPHTFTAKWEANGLPNTGDSGRAGLWLAFAAAALAALAALAAASAVRRSKQIG